MQDEPDRSAPAEPGRGTLLLGRGDTAALLDSAALVAAVEAAFRGRARGDELGTVIAGLACGAGVFHVKGCGRRSPRPRVVFKLNANFPDNPERHGLPTIQGVIVLADGERGTLLALLDSTVITAARTAAVTAVAAKCLARSGALRTCIVGCGVQGGAHADLLADVLPIAALLCHDRDGARAEALAGRMRRERGLDARAVGELADAVTTADLVVTCTTARSPVVAAEWVRPGALVAAIGADHEAKQELDPRLFAGARVVVDDRAQCAAAGELRRALAAGVVGSPADAVELHDVLAGRVPGRRSEREIVVFDSTGTPAADLAAATLAFERAASSGVGSWIRLDR